MGLSKGGPYKLTLVHNRQHAGCLTREKRFTKSWTKHSLLLETC